MKDFSTMLGTIRFILARNKTSQLYIKVAIAIIAANIQQILPGIAQPNLANSGYYPIVYATKDIKAGSSIIYVSDIDVVEVPRDEVDMHAALSPQEIVGYRTKRGLRKNQIIVHKDIDYRTRLKLTGATETKIANSEYSYIAYATRNIKAGSLIESLSDLGVVKKQKKGLLPNSVFSPREILGYKTKRELQKNQAITYQDIDFKMRVDGSKGITQALILSEQLKIARTKWSSPSDDYWELCGPGRSVLFNQGGGVIIATKNIKKGSLILEASDVEILIVLQSHIPGGAIVSPFRVIGGKAKYDISKHCIISMQDLDFSSRLSNRQKQLIKEKIRLAGQKWTGISVDDFLKDDGVLKL